MYSCHRCGNLFRLYHEDEERHTTTCPHCGSEHFDSYEDEDLFDHEEEEEEEDDRRWYDFMVSMVKGRQCGG